MPSNLASPPSSRRTYRLIVYDLDGTLVDTVLDLRTAVNLALIQRGHREVSLEAVQKAIGDGARVLMERLAPEGSDPREIDALLECFRGHYLRVCLDQSTLRDHAGEFVRSRALDLPGRVQAILTNKPQAPTDLLVHHFGLQVWIGRALGGDTELGRKPDPTGLLDLVRWAGVESSQVLLVGDGPADLAVAQAAGVDSVRLDGGYGQSLELDPFPSTWRARDFRELESLWPRIEPHRDL